MLSEEQRSMVMKLFKGGMNISEISRKVGVSRPTIYRVLESDVEKDAEILELEKKLRKTELEMKIRKLREPLKRRDKIDELMPLINALMSNTLELWDHVLKDAPRCFYCGADLEYYDTKDKENSEAGYKCNNCRKKFPFR